MKKTIIAVLLTTSISITCSEKKLLPGQPLIRKTYRRQNNPHRYYNQASTYFTEQRELQRKKEAELINSGIRQSPQASPTKPAAKKIK
jgi:hypothetical protein